MTPLPPLRLCPAYVLVPLSDFLGLPPGYISEEDREGVDLEYYAAILEKPR